MADAFLFPVRRIAVREMESLWNLLITFTNLTQPISQHYFRITPPDFKRFHSTLGKTSERGKSLTCGVFFKKWTVELSVQCMSMRVKICGLEDFG